jgi:hypothetical protein
MSILVISKLVTKGVLQFPEGFTILGADFQVHSEGLVDRLVIFKFVHPFGPIFKVHCEEEVQGAAKVRTV